MAEGCRIVRPAVRTGARACRSVGGVLTTGVLVRTVLVLGRRNHTMKSPWKSLGRFEPDRSYLVLASSIPPRTLSSTWRMFRGASAVRKQLAKSEGVIGFSLLARPLRNQYATLSVWSDDEALSKFSAASPHHELMDDFVAGDGPDEVRAMDDQRIRRPAIVE